jgi:hypothetical protein
MCFRAVVKFISFLGNVLQQHSKGWSIEGKGKGNLWLNPTIEPCVSVWLRNSFPFFRKCIAATKQGFCDRGSVLFG